VIRFAFDHHQCSDCVDIQRAHRIRARLVDGQYFWFCTGCGDVEGPYAQLPAGERVAVAGDGPAAIEEADGAEAVEIERESAASLAETLAERFDVHDRDGLIAAIVEARAIRERARSAEPTDTPAIHHLRQIIDRAERLIDERAEISATLRDVFSFAKEIGFNTKAIRHVIDARAKLPELRKIEEAEFAVYRSALGIEGPEYAVALPVPMLEAAKPRAVPKKVQERRASVALAQLAEQARSN